MLLKTTGRHEVTVLSLDIKRSPCLLSGKWFVGSQGDNRKTNEEVVTSECSWWPGPETGQASWVCDLHKALIQKGHFFNFLFKCIYLLF